MSIIKEINKSFVMSKENTGRVCMSLGVKSGGKSYFMNKFLEYCFKKKLYEMYVLVLPAYSIEANDSYKFINSKDPNILIFEEYSPVIPQKIMNFQKNQLKKKKDKKKILFVIDDASGEAIDSLHLDQSLKRLITSIRHYKTFLWCIAHAVSGTLSTFMRSNTDILILYNITNQNLLEQLYDEYLSLNKEFRKHENNRQNKSHFINTFLELMEEQYSALYLNLRTRAIHYDLKENIDKLT